MESLLASCHEGPVEVSHSGVSFRAQAAPHRYLAYGTRILSEVELWPGERAVIGDDWRDDVRVVARASGRAKPRPSAASPNLAHFEWPGFAEIWVQNGRRIALSIAADADRSEIAAAVSGPALATALGQRGLLVLHGTCVAFGERAVCLLGDSGMGKSTLAAALCARGGALVSDTMTVVDLAQGTPLVRVGPARFKLWPDAASMLGWDPEVLPGAAPGSDKRVCVFRGKMAPPGVTLDRIFLLSANGPVSSAAVTPAAAVVAVLRNHFLSAFLGFEQLKHWLPRCARLVESTTVRTLCRGQSLTDLQDAVRLLCD